MNKKQQTEHEPSWPWIFIERFFWPVSLGVERALVRILLILCLGLVVVQGFVLSSETYQSLANKAVRYEGVFHEQQEPTQPIFRLQD